MSHITLPVVTKRSPLRPYPPRPSRCWSPHHALSPPSLLHTPRRALHTTQPLLPGASLLDSKCESRLHPSPQNPSHGGDDNASNKNTEHLKITSNNNITNDNNNKNKNTNPQFLNTGQQNVLPHNTNTNHNTVHPPNPHLPPTPPASPHHDILHALSRAQSTATAASRASPTPWRLLTPPRRHRVLDTVGLLDPTHRVEMEHLADQIRSLCGLEFTLVLVPTVGYVPPRVFAQSLFHEWGSGGEAPPRLLCLVAHHEASLQLVASYALDEYFGGPFATLLVREVLQPRLREGDPSLGMVHLVQAVGRHAAECRGLWQPRWVTLRQKERLRVAQQMVYFGALRTHTFWATLFFSALTVWLGFQIADLRCEKCGTFMRVGSDPAKGLTSGQRVEMASECARYRVWECPNCGTHKGVLVSRDYHNYANCLLCPSCRYHTTTVTSDVLRLASKTEDGVKQFVYDCKNCGKHEKVFLPLFHPMEEAPKEWYDFLVKRANEPNTKEGIKVV